VIRLLKKIVRLVLQSIVEPIYFWCYSRYLNLIYRFQGIEGINLVMLRTRFPKYILTKFGAKIGEGTVVYPHIFIHAAKNDYSNLVVGKNCRILRDCFLDLTDRIELCDTAHIGIRVSIITHLNVGDSRLKDVYPTVSGCVKIGKGTVTTAGAIILHGVTLGEYCIIGAGSVVSTEVPDYSVVVGNPGRIIKKIEIKENCE